MSGRNMAFLAHLSNFLLLVALWALAAWTFDRLPDQVPMHFDASGMPDRISDRSYAEWMLLPICAVGMTLFIYLCALFVLLVRRRPRLVNLPRRLKERFVRLAPARREPILEIITACTFWVAVPTNGLCIWIQWIMYRSAIGGRLEGSVWAPMIAYTLVLVAMCAGFYVWMKIAIERAETSRRSS